MTCPFLKEAQVKYCQTATVRKLIPLAQTGRADEKCASSAHATCPVYRMQPQGDASGPCPHLRESLMQYCGAASVTKFVPYSESLISRCGNDGFRYCELYLAMAHPGAAEEVDGIPLPGWLQYSANHMWLDVTDDGTCHAGIDGFLSRVLGKVDRISYVRLSGTDAAERRAVDCWNRFGSGFSEFLPADQVQRVSARRPVADYGRSVHRRAGSLKACRDPTRRRICCADRRLVNGWKTRSGG